MGFRRSVRDEPEHERWRRANRSLLVLCGVSDEVAGCGRRWSYVLGHGHDHGTGWTPSRLSPTQAADLLRALEGEPA